jgi:nucleotide-binding universal stress UspA family protein
MSKARVMVALHDSASVESLVNLACHLSQTMDADLVALYVVELPPVTPLDALDESIDRSGKELLAQAARVAGKLSMSLSHELLRAREAGGAIVGAAKERGADLLIIGHHKPHPHPLGETLLGGVVHYVAHHAPCRVIVQIPAPEHR